MKTLWIGCFSVMAVSAMAASLNVEPTAWTVTYKQNASVTQVAGGGVTVGFNAQPTGTIPPTMLVNASAAGAAFVGNYAEAGAKGVTFTLNHTGAAGTLGLSLALPSGKEWKKTVELPAAQGQAVPIVIPFTTAAGWKPGWTSQPLANADTQLQSALLFVSTLGIEVAPELGAAAQSYTLDSFVLGGAGTIPSALDTRILDAMRDRFGAGIASYADVTAEQKAIDTDRDGMSDYLEIMAGTKWNDASSVFAAAIVDQGPAGTKIRWPSQADATYTIWRSSDLASGFYPLETGWAAAGATTEYTDTTAGEAANYFYKVSQE